VLRVAHHAPVSAWRQRERELSALGVDLHLISSKRWNGGGKLVELQPGDDTFVEGVRTVGTHPSVFAFNPWPIWRALGQKPDLIDLHEEPNALATAEILALRWLRRSRAPYLLYSAQNIEKRYPVPFRWFEKRALRGAAAAYVCNVEAGEILERKGLAGPAVSIPLGVDLHDFSPAERDEPGPHPVIGYVGRLEKHKGVAVLLDAVALNSEWRLRIVGDGPESTTLRARARTLGIADRVEFVGFVQGEQLAARYRELDVLAVPSLPTPSWREQFGRVAVEAMASGVPVVASSSGALPDVVAAAGVLVEPGDAVDLARGLFEALSPGTWADLRARSLEHARAFSWRRVAEQQNELYEQVLGIADGAEGKTLSPAVLIVAYGSPQLLEECLDELTDAFTVTVVDNSSDARTLALAESRGARYVDAGANIGFAAGVNLGLSAIDEAGHGAADVLLLNPDARIGPDAVRRMHRELRRGPHTAVIGATQTDPATGCPVRVWWPFPTPRGAWLEALGFGRFRRAKDFVIGSVLLLRREALAEVGLFDERFFLYSEETDWQFRARRLGWAIELSPAPATHVGAGTGGDPQVRETHFFTSLREYVVKHHGRAGWQSFRMANRVGAGIRGALSKGARRQAALRRRALFSRGGLPARKAQGEGESLAQAQDTGADSAATRS
jgi:glycosyltransferase involved in cell wall biosynthesis/GT2 family glycosyltransferase